MNKRRSRVQQFGLYGEGLAAIEPEFAHIETISAGASLHNWAIEPHIHPCIFQLLHLVSGDGWLAIDGAEHRLEPPCLVVVPCGCTHAFRFTPLTGGRIMSIADSLVADSRLAGFKLAAVARGGEVLRLPLGDDPARNALLETLLAEFSRRQGEGAGHLGTSTVALIGLILTTAEELAEAAAWETASGQNRRIALVRRFIGLVEMHYPDHWPVERYAAELGTTTPTLTRACREVTGRAPGRITRDRQLREAMRALSYTTASISEISDDLGFSDPTYFARIFRKHCGVTASAFRRERVWRAGPGKIAVD